MFVVRHEGLAGSGKPAFDAAKWSGNCTSAYASILGIGAHALNLETRHAEARSTDAFRTGAMSAAVLVLVGFLGFISLRFVKTRLSEPMHAIDVALAKLRAGELDAPIRLPRWNDEPGAVMRALEGFRLEALEARRMRLHIDKLRDELVIHAENVGRAKSRFLATMSHEIRTPLHGILGVAQLLAESPVSDEQRAWVRALDRSGRLLRDILDDILDFTRLESGRVTVEAIPFSVRERIAMIESSIRPMIESKSLKFGVNVDRNLPDVFVGDAGKLSQILLNLLGNAAKFTNAGRVDLDIRRDTARLDRLRIMIADTGIGIAPAALVHLFEPFSQADASVARRFGGSGLGLAVCRGLLDVLGGEIDLETDPGRGTTFTVLFPIQEATITLAPAPLDDEALPQLTVLVAEDNAVNALIVRSMLERDGHIVRHVETGSAALAAATSEDFDVVLMDVAMPETNGVDACRLIRACGHATRAVVPILAVSAGGAGADDLGAGFDGELEKPFRLESLRAALAEVLGLRPPRAEGGRERLGVLGEQARDLGVEGARKLVDLYLSSQPPLLAEAVAAARRGDHERARALSHRLKGAAAHLGADDLAAAAAALESAATGFETSSMRSAADALEALGRTHFGDFATRAEAELARPGANDHATFAAKT